MSTAERIARACMNAYHRAPSNAEAIDAAIRAVERELRGTGIVSGMAMTAMVEAQDRQAARDADVWSAAKQHAMNVVVDSLPRRNRPGRRRKR